MNFRKIQTLHAYVDGSFRRPGSPSVHPQIGCGVYFGPDDPENRAIPVPCTLVSAPLNGSLRAELYASLLSVYLTFDVKHCSVRSTRLVIHQDSQVAMDLLRACRFQGSSQTTSLINCPSHMCPTKWATTTECASWDPTWKRWRKLNIKYCWGETLDFKMVLQHADILDAWWLATKRYDAVHYSKTGEKQWIHIDFVKAHAHQTAPSPAHPDFKQWLGNDTADRMAREASLINRTDLSCVVPFRDYPLFLKDSWIPWPTIRVSKKDSWLPLKIA